MALSNSFLHHLAHDVGWALEVEALTRTYIHLQCDGVEFSLAVHRRLRALGQVLAGQAIDVFVAAAQPRTMRVERDYRHAGSLGYCDVLRNLPPIDRRS
jgi:hypothetical protein